MSHWYLCTWNNPPEDCWLQLTAKHEPDYLIGQKEKVETLHCQFVMYFKVGKTKSTLIKNLTGVFYDAKPASAARDIITYVSKEESRIPDSAFSFGKAPRLTKVKDENDRQTAFEQTLELLKSGEFEATLPEHQVKFFGNLLKLLAYYSKNSDKEAVRGIWIYGPSGAGKSFKARELAGGNGTFYAKPQSKWWDNYTGQKIVILDDFDPMGSGLSHYLKIWLDRYAFIAEIKGGSIKPDYDTFIITSQYLPKDIWPNDQPLIDAISRRCKFIELQHRVVEEKDMWAVALSKFLER